MSTENPLLKYYRQPKIFIKLPSKGKFYSKGSLDVSKNKEYPVYPMNAKDEILLKTPDALLNGEATVSVIKSCVPSILDPWEMPSVDLDTVLAAIRIASYGENLEIDSKCPECEEENTHVFNLVSFLENNSKVNIKDSVTFDESGLTVYIRPYSYRELSQVRFKTIEQQNILKIINNKSLSDEEKIRQFNASFVSLTDLTINIIIGCITCIETADGEKVEDKELIAEFLNNSSKEYFNKISDLVKQMKNDVDIKPTPVVCGSCSHQYEVMFALDNSNFFNQGSAG